MGQPVAEAEKSHWMHGERRDSRLEGWRDWELELGSISWVGSVVKHPPANEGDAGDTKDTDLVSGLERSLE